MKSLIISCVSTLFLLPMIILAQEPDPNQNPNYKLSIEKYRLRKDSLLRYMGETIQDQYVAIDPIAERQQRRLSEKRDRLAFRRALRLERARRPFIPYSRPRFRNPRPFNPYFNNNNFFPYDGWWLHQFGNNNFHRNGFHHYPFYY